MTRNGTYEGSLAVPGCRLRYRVDGAAPDKPWIVFSNSLLTNLSLWEGQVAALASRFAILRYDQRGHGGSEFSEAAVDFDLLGQDVIALLDAFDVARCTYVGLSMGVPTGLAAWSRNRERFGRLVFADGAAKTAPTGKAFWDERIGLARDAGMEALADATVQRWFSDKTTDAAKRAALKDIILSTPQEGFVQCARALQNYDFAERVGQIDCPLLAIAGAEDGVMPDTMQATFAAPFGGKAVLIPGSGHVPNFENPDLFNRELTRFLEAA